MIFNIANADDINKNISDVTDSVLALQDELTANNTRLYFDFKDGKYGYNTDPKRGADTFNPFKSGGGNESPYTVLNTVINAKGNELPTIYGNGFITIRRTSASSNGADNLVAYIDDNTSPFPIASYNDSYVRGGYYKLYFKKSIRFSGGISTNFYFYQTQLSASELEDKCNIVQGVTSDDEYITISGKGKILICAMTFTTVLYYKIDDMPENELYFHGYQHMEFNFNKGFKFKSQRGSSYKLYYIAYTEI